MIFYRQCIGLSIITPHRSTKETVDDMVIDPVSGKLLGIITSNRAIIRFSSCVGFGPTVQVKSSADFLSLSECPDIEVILRSGISYISSTVKTEDFRIIGRCTDISFHESFGTLISLYVEKPYSFLFESSPLIIPEASIIRVEKDAIIVDNSALLFEKEISTV